MHAAPDQPLAAPPWRVAAVDALPLFAEVLAAVVGAWPQGKFVVQAVDADDYVRACTEAGHVHLALVDLHLPGRDGIELLRWMHRHQLRTPLSWEHARDDERNPNLPQTTERPGPICQSEMARYLAPEELMHVNAKSNMAAQLLKTQSVRLQQLRDAGYFEDFRHMDFNELIAQLYAEQGRAERIKNFPFLRQYASTALWLTVVFATFVPLGMLDVIPRSAGWLFWGSPFLSGLIIWIFFLMEMIGDYSENPFEGTYNDVPITSIARGIEIDLREMIDDTDIPAPVVAENGFVM